MPAERCRICDGEVLYSNAVHATMHTGDEEGVVDFYVCRRCYEEELSPLFEEAEPA